MTIGPDFSHYRFFHVVDKTAKATLFSNTVEFHRFHLSQPTLTPSERITYALSILYCIVQDLPAITSNAQLDAITSIKALLEKWPPLTSSLHLHPSRISAAWISHHQPLP